MPLKLVVIFIMTLDEDDKHHVCVFIDLIHEEIMEMCLMHISIFMQNIFSALLSSLIIAELNFRVNNKMSKHEQKKNFKRFMISDEGLRKVI